MDKTALLSMASSFIRQFLVYALAKLGLSAIISDADMAKVAEGVVIVALALYSAWSKRQALLTTPPDVSKSTAVRGATTLLAILLLPALLLSGCAVISGKAGSSSYVGLAFGEKASSQLAGLNITETETKSKAGVSVFDRGVGLDKSSTSGEADMGKILGNLLLLGLQSQGVPVKASAATQTDSVDALVASATPEYLDAVTKAAACDASTPSTDTAAVSYSADGYNGAPGAGGMGVYGHPTCSRCRDYHTAHPEVQIVNIDTPANLSAMWSALRARGFTATSASLPIEVTADAYTLSAQ